MPTRNKTKTQPLFRFDDFMENMNIYQTARLVVPLAASETIRANLGEIQAKTDCTVIFQDEEPSKFDKTLFVSSNSDDTTSNYGIDEDCKERPFNDADAENVRKITAAVMEIANLAQHHISEYYQKYLGKNWGNPLLAGSNPEMAVVIDENDENGGAPGTFLKIETKLLMHTNTAGKIFGVKGTNIRRLSEKYVTKGCVIEMKRQHCPDSDDRILTLIGTPELMSELIAEVLKTIRINNLEKFANNRQFYNPKNAEDSDYGSYACSAPKRTNSPGKPHTSSENAFRDNNRKRDRFAGYNPANTGYDSKRSKPITGSWQGNREPTHNKRSQSKFLVPENGARLRWLIQRWVGGKIIGRGADRIKQLRKKHSHAVKIDIHDSNCEDRVVELLASKKNLEENKEKILECFEDIASTIADDLKTSAISSGYTLVRSSGRGGKNSSAPYESSDRRTENLTEVRLIINGNTMGRVIGAKACNIKELRGMCETVVAYSNSCPGSNDRILALTGTVQQVVAAVTKVLDHVVTCQKDESGTAYDPNNLAQNASYNTEDYGGFLVKSPAFRLGGSTQAPMPVELSNNIMAQGMVAHGFASPPAMPYFPPPMQNVMQPNMPPSAYDQVHSVQAQSLNRPVGQYQHQQTWPGQPIKAQTHAFAGDSNYEQPAVAANAQQNEPPAGFHPIGSLSAKPAEPRAIANDASVFAGQMGLTLADFNALKEKILAESTSR